MEIDELEQWVETPWSDADQAAYDAWLDEWAAYVGENE